MGLKIQRRITSKLRTITTLSALFALVAQPMYGLVAAQVANAADTDIVVRGNSLQGWTEYKGSGGTSAFVKDGSVGTKGKGALKLSTPSSSASVMYYRDAATPTGVENINVSYSSKSLNSVANAAPSYVLGIDPNGDGDADDEMYAWYEPVYNSGSAYTKWNTWTVNQTAKFWSKSAVGSKGGVNGANLFTLVDLKAAYPDAKVIDYTINQGSGNTGWSTLVDNVKTPEATYDFEATLNPVLAPTNFNTNNDANYKGINAGFTLNDDFENVTNVKVELKKDGNVLVTNTSNTELLTLINGGEKSLSTPFIVTPGSYVEEYWNLGQRDWLRTDKPTQVTISVTDNNGTKIVSNASLAEPNGWTFETLFTDYVQKPSDSKFVSTSQSVRENNSSDLAAYVVVPKPATEVKFTFTGLDGAPTRTGVGSEHLQMNQWPSANGSHQYRVGVSVPAGEYSVAAWYKTSDGTGNWYQVTGTATLHSVKTPIATYVTPEADGSTVIRTHDNPSQVRVSDNGSHFKSIEFVIDSVSYTVDRSKCDLRQAGNYVICKANDATNWPVPGLTDGSHTVNKVVARNSANGNVTLPARTFLVDSEAPVVINSKISNPNVSVYAKSVTVSTQVTDNVNLKSVTVYAVKQLNGVCNPNGTQVLAHTTTVTGTNKTVTTEFDTSALNGSYCFYATVKDQANTSSNPNTANAKFVANFDNDAPADPTNLSWIGSDSTSAKDGFTNVQNGTLSWDNSTLADVDHYVYKFWTNIPGYWDDANSPWQDVEMKYVEKTLTGGQVPTGFADKEGTYHFCITAVDNAGNSSNCTALAVTYDNTAPVAHIVSPVAGAVNGMVTVKGAVTDDNRMNSYFAITGPNSYSVSDLKTTGLAEHAYSWDTSTLAKGTYTITFATRDKAQNRDEVKSVDSIKVAVDNTKPDATVNTENFNTNDDANYKGLNVGFNIDNFAHVDSVTVGLYKDGASDAFVTNSDNAKLLDLINNDEVKQLSTPFIIQSGSYIEEYWNLGKYNWSASDTAPVMARVTVMGTDLNGLAFTKSADITSIANQDAAPFAALVPAAAVVSTDTPRTSGGNGGEEMTTRRSINVPSRVLNPGFNTGSTVFGAPVLVAQANDTDEDVLGAKDTPKPTTNDTVAAIAPSSQGWKIFGMAWFWWVLILVALTAAWLWFAAASRRRKEENAL